MAIAPHPIAGHHWKKSGTILLTPTFKIFVCFLLFYILRLGAAFGKGGCDHSQSQNPCPNSLWPVLSHVYLFLTDFSPACAAPRIFLSTGTHIMWGKEVIVQICLLLHPLGLTMCQEAGASFDKCLTVVSASSLHPQPVISNGLMYSI